MAINLITTTLASFGQIWLNRAIGRIIRYAILLILFQFGLIIFFFSRLPPEIPFYFSRSWGSQQLASPLSLLFLPLFSIALLLINTFIAASLINKSQFLASAITATTLVFSSFSLIALIKIFTLII